MTSRYAWRSIAGLAAPLVLLLPLAGCGNDPENQSRKSPGAGDKSAAAEPSETAPPPITVGTQPYVSPCRLFTGQDVTEVYGKLGPYASFYEEGIDAPAPADQYGAPVRTACNYGFDNKANTSVVVRVEQYPTPAYARKAFRSTLRLGKGTLSRQIEKDLSKDSPLADVLRGLLEIQKENEAKDGGVRTPAIGENILFVPGRGAFEALRGNTLIRIERSQYETSPFEATSIRGSVTQTRTAYERIDARLAALADDQTLADPWWPRNATIGWPRPLRACDILNKEIMQQVSGLTIPDDVTSNGLFLRPEVRAKRNTLPGARSVSNSCERRQNPEDRKAPSVYTELQVWYGPPNVTGAQVLDGAIIRTISGVSAESEMTVDDWRKQGYLSDIEVDGTDKAYYVATPQSDGSSHSWVAAQVGDHVLIFSAYNFHPGEGPSHVRIKAALLLEAMEPVIANARAAIG